jgi:hypothetical protein
MTLESSNPPLNRGNLMRQIAALHAQMARTSHNGSPPQLTEPERKNLLQQIVVLEKRLLTT